MKSLDDFVPLKNCNFERYCASVAIPSAMKYVMVLVLECQLIIGKVGKEEGGMKLLDIVFIRNMMSERMIMSSMNNALLPNIFVRY